MDKRRISDLEYRLAHVEDELEKGVEFTYHDAGHAPDGEGAHLRQTVVWIRLGREWVNTHLTTMEEVRRIIKSSFV
jgi:hypothetical protein